MRELAGAQARSGRYAGVGFALITYRDWPERYERELHESGLPVFRAFTPRLFGTASFLLQRFRHAPIARWAVQLARRSGTESVIVHFHNAWMSGVFLPLHAPADVSLRTVVTFHGVNRRLLRMPVRRGLHCWMAGRTGKYADMSTSVDACSPAVAGEILGISRDAFRVVPNGVQDTNLRGCPRIMGRDVFTIGQIGSVEEAKGWRIAVESALTPAGKNRKVRLIIAGDGPDAAHAAATAAAHPDVIEYRGFVGRARDTVMPELDALCIMSEQEGLPMTLIEAFSLGIPVIATPVGGIPEAIVDGRNGFLSAPNAEGLSRAVSALTDDPALHESMSRVARRTFEERYEITRVVSLYDRVYRDAMLA